MTMLTADQLTGRSREHVVELSEFKCSLHLRAAEAFLGMRKAAAAAGKPDYVFLWAGTGYRHATAEPAADILRRLASNL